MENNNKSTKHLSKSPSHTKKYLSSGNSNNAAQSLTTGQKHPPSQSQYSLGNKHGISLNLNKLMQFEQAKKMRLQETNPISPVRSTGRFQIAD